MKNLPVKVTQILYSGLGGHAAVAFSLTDATESLEHMQHHLLFYGIEEVKSAYVEKCIAHGLAWNAVLKKPGLDVRSIREVFSILQKQKPTVVILHSVNLIVPVYLCSVLFNFKVIAVEHQANHLKTKNDWLFSRLCMLLAHRVVYLTDDYKNEVREKLSGLYRQKKVHVIPNGINIHYFRPVKKETRNSFRFGMLSRINDIKDHETLLKAFAALSSASARLVIAGEGPKVKPLKEFAAELDIEDRVDFLGLIEGQKILDFFREIDVYVHATLGETMSTSIMQAMACGLPVIASAVKGTENMINSGVNGLLVPVKDPDALARCMADLRSDTGKREAFSTAARRYAETHFSNETMFLKYNELITYRHGQ